MMKDQPFEVKDEWPSFADKLTLRLSVKIRTVQEQNGTRELTPLKLWLPKGEKWASESASRLRAYISSKELWDLKVNADNYYRESIWNIPKHGNFRLFYIRGKDGKVSWERESDFVSKIRSETLLPKKLILDILRLGRSTPSFRVANVGSRLRCFMVLAESKSSILRDLPC